jgi:hypothetical protein
MVLDTEAERERKFKSKAHVFKTFCPFGTILGAYSINVEKKWKKGPKIKNK